jgi:hypothetical protein
MGGRVEGPYCGFDMICFFEVCDKPSMVGADRGRGTAGAVAGGWRERLLPSNRGACSISKFNTAARARARERATTEAVTPA